MPARRAGVEVDGLAALRRQLRALGDDLTDLKAANAAVGAFVANRAAPRAPRRTGRLAASTRAGRAAGAATVSAGGAAVPYAGPIHWGWARRNIAPHPWIADTAKDTQSQWLPIYEQELQKLADKVRGAAAP